MSEATAFRLAPLAPSGRAGREADRAAGYAAGWAAGATAAAERAAAQRAELAAAQAAAEQRREAAVRGAVERLARAAAAADARTAPVLAQAQQTLAETALALAEAVLGHALADGPTGARAALRRALDTPAELGVHTVRLAPADLAALTAEGVAAPAGVELVADPRLAPGDAVSEHPAGYLDARLATALARARAELLGGER